MSKITSFLIAFTIIIIPIIFFYSNPGNQTSSDTSNIINPASESTIVSANILPSLGGLSASVKVYGYTSPHALVYLTGHGTTETAIANDNGEFTFLGTKISENTKEICLYAKDTDGRISQPTCVPIYFTPGLEGIGPIILAPTFTVAKSEVAPNEKILFGGQSIPNKFVRIFISGKTPIKNGDGLPSRSQIRLSTDENGLFYFSTQSDTPQTKDAYSSIQYNGKNSPKSTTLTVKILPWWLVHLRELFGIIARYALEMSLVAEALIALLYFIYFRKKTKHPLAIFIAKSLAKSENHFLLVNKVRQ